MWRILQMHRDRNIHRCVSRSRHTSKQRCALLLLHFIKGRCVILSPLFPLDNFNLKKFYRFAQKTTRMKSCSAYELYESSLRKICEKFKLWKLSTLVLKRMHQEGTIIMDTLHSPASDSRPSAWDSILRCWSRCHFRNCWKCCRATRWT